MAGIDLDCGMSELKIRMARKSDIAEIVKLLADDILGKTRESADVELYESGFNAILNDENNYFFVADLDHKIVGCFQLTFIPSLSRGAAMRGQIESVRVNVALRGQNIGTKMMQWAIEFCKNNGCKLVQLTTDKHRVQAHEFYNKLGFESSHIGMKLDIGE